MIEGVNKVVGKGVITSTTKVSVYEGTVYADVLGDGVILIAGPKLEEKAGVWLATKLPHLSLISSKISSVPGGKTILGFISLKTH
ncbi:hypothetical protein E3E36_08995 [Thermococcus sp. M36]|nr:hypothetical protein [Thermococcus sp. M36]